MRSRCIFCSTTIDVDYKSGVKPFCPECFNSGCFVPEALDHPTMGWARDVQELKTPAELRKKIYPSFSISDRCREMIGSLGGEFCFVIYGRPGTQKTTWALSFVDMLLRENPGDRAIYNSLEEGFSYALADKLERLEITNDDFLFGVQTNLEGLSKTVSENGVSIVIMDSFNAGSVQLVQELSSFHKETGVSLVVILHSTKAGLPAGRTAIIHYADIVMRAYMDEEDLMYEVEKNRFGLVGNGRILYA